MSEDNSQSTIPNIPQELPGTDTVASNAREAEANAFKIQAQGYDPIGDGDIHTCGGRIVDKYEKVGGGPAELVRRCSRCGKDPME